MLPNLANLYSFVIWTGIEMRFPKDCFPAVACYRNGVIVSCTLDAAFIISELLHLRSLIGWGGCATRLFLMSLVLTDTSAGNMWQGCNLQLVQ